MYSPSPELEEGERLHLLRVLIDVGSMQGLSEELLSAPGVSVATVVSDRLHQLVVPAFFHRGKALPRGD